MMQQRKRVHSDHGIDEHGIHNANSVWWNLSTPVLYEHALQRHEGLLAHLGPLVVRTGQITGRSAKDKYVVREPSSEEKIWWGDVNPPFAIERYRALNLRLTAYLQGNLFCSRFLMPGCDRKRHGQGKTRLPFKCSNGPKK